MMMSRGTRKQSIHGGRRSSTSKQPKVPTLQDFNSKRDFTGALALLEFQRRNGGDENEADEVQTLMWIGFCAFHLGKYERAQEVYTDLMSGNYGKVSKMVGMRVRCGDRSLSYFACSARRRCPCT